MCSFLFLSNGADEAVCRIVSILPGPDNSDAVIAEVTTEFIPASVEKIGDLYTALVVGSPSTIDALETNLSPYTVTIVSTSVGNSESSAPESQIDEPSPPRDVGVSFPVSECGLNANVTWEVPTDDGEATISNYLIECETTGESVAAVTTLTPSGGTSVVVGPLEPGRDYRCSVIAMNMKGDSPETISSSSFQVK